MTTVDLTTEEAAHVWRLIDGEIAHWGCAVCPSVKAKLEPIINAAVGGIREQLPKTTIRKWVNDDYFLLHELVPELRAALEYFEDDVPRHVDADDCPHA